MERSSTLTLLLLNSTTGHATWLTAVHIKRIPGARRSSSELIRNDR